MHDDKLTTHEDLKDVFIHVALRVADVVGFVNAWALARNEHVVHLGEIGCAGNGGVLRGDVDIRCMPRLLESRNSKKNFKKKEASNEYSPRRLEKLFFLQGNVTRTRAVIAVKN